MGDITSINGREFKSEPKLHRQDQDRHKQVVSDAHWLRCLAEDMERSGYETQDRNLRAIAARIEQMDSQLLELRKLTGPSGTSSEEEQKYE